jgi:hypothetical protein
MTRANAVDRLVNGAIGWRNQPPRYDLTTSGLPIRGERTSISAPTFE